jgi:hypothetical protein
MYQLLVECRDGTDRPPARLIHSRDRQLPTYPCHNRGRAGKVSRVNGRCQGWEQTDEPTRRLLQLDNVDDLGTLRALFSIYDLGTPGAHVDLAPMFARLDFDGEGMLDADLRGLEQDGLLEFESDFEGASATLTPAGVGYVERIRELGGDLAGRRSAARDAFLYWLAQQSIGGHGLVNVSEIFGTKYTHYYGPDLTEAEIADAVRWLEYRGYIEGREAGVVGEFATAKITATGKSIVEAACSVNHHHADVEDW